MPLNLLKIYNQLLELAYMNEFQREKSLKGIFERDITNNLNFVFQSKKLNPTPADGQDSMERLFTHLTTVITDKSVKKRAFDMARSIRLHWLKYHVEENKKENMLVFSVAEPDGTRTYIYDKDEYYVIVLEPMRKKNEYYLLTAYYLEGKDKARDKMMKKYKRRLADVA
ncbi:MAG: hypothetical protein LBQ31_10450 [Bacteroidales bacterium]|jgi:hypothetical protein|nr:hypothetical protein [Bacteroidales bacterium]